MICPFCKEEIKEGAIKCKHCGSMLSSQGNISATATPTADGKVVCTDYSKVTLHRKNWFAILKKILKWTFIVLWLINTAVGGIAGAIRGWEKGGLIRGLAGVLTGICSGATFGFTKVMGLTEEVVWDVGFMNPTIAGGIVWLLSVIVWIRLGMRSEPFYKAIETMSLHSKSINPFVFDLVLKGRDSKGIRFIALTATGAIFSLVPAIIIAIIIGNAK